ncbi:uncharacterized protein L203_103065 [Cryptococcus depauperatus CBS 7841]|uniref:Rubisco LSMT substrate-binding domain-containing protein n=1 Tax=Cryptococcus depauperatus CBS 7841 TaxID=1295531 RepID=A0AAJ8M1B0_9TREE
MPTKTTTDWERLTDWLHEAHSGFKSCLSLRDVPGVVRGLVVAEDVREKTALLHIPSSAMLNPLTLMAADSVSKHNLKQPVFSIPRHLFPLPAHHVSHNNSSKRVKTLPISPPAPTGLGRQLDTTELLTLHLALNRDPMKRYTSDWQVYIETLPKEFRPWHPLTWVIEPEKGSDVPGAEEWRWWHHLYEKYASRTLKAKVREVKQRYETDIATLRDVLHKEEPFKSHSLATTLTQEDLLWAWLNVNTRSISIPLGLPGPTERMNHTLVPILDMVNHSSDTSIASPRVRQLSTPSSASASGNRRGHKPSASGDWSGNGNKYSRNGVHLIPGRIDLRLIAPERGMNKGEEVVFEYGGHSSATLFAEYGFCEVPEGHGDEKWLKLKYGELDVGWLVDELWKETAMSPEDEEDQAEKKQVLEAIGCWRQNIIHTNPLPPHPSHSLLMTLRVFHLPRNSVKLPNIKGGYSTYVAPSNELAMIYTLENICKKIMKDSEKRLQGLKKEEKHFRQNDVTDEEKSGVVRMMKGMCIEEQILAKKVLERIEKGEDLS